MLLPRLPPIPQTQFRMGVGSLEVSLRPDGTNQQAPWPQIPLHQCCATPEWAGEPPDRQWHGIALRTTGTSRESRTANPTRVLSASCRPTVESGMKPTQRAFRALAI